jgi:hypothetical protein
MHKCGLASVILCVHIRTVFQKQCDQARIFRGASIPDGGTATFIPTIGICCPTQ